MFSCIFFCKNIGIGIIQSSCFLTIQTILKVMTEHFVEIKKSNNTLREIICWGTKQISWVKRILLSWQSPKDSHLNSMNDYFGSKNFTPRRKVNTIETLESWTTKITLLSQDLHSLNWWNYFCRGKYHGKRSWFGTVFS